MRQYMKPMSWVIYKSDEQLRKDTGLEVPNLTCCIMLAIESKKNILITELDWIAQAN